MPSRLTLQVPAILRALVATLTVDILDLDHRWGSPRSGEPVADFTWYKLLRGHAQFLRNFVVDLKQPRFAIRQIPENALLFAIQSKNQHDAVASIIESLPKATMLSINAEREGGCSFPTSSAYAIACLFWPILVMRLLLADSPTRARLAQKFANFLLAYGYFCVGVMISLVTRPRMLIVANDHTMTTRSLAKAAMSQGVRVAYVPHASVTDAFPRLEWDYAFLDGLDSLEKYERCGEVSATVFLCGMPRFDKYHTGVHATAPLGTLGICLGLYDEASVVRRVCAAIQVVVADVKLVLRPHPGDRRDWRALVHGVGVMHSDSTLEDAFEYLRRVDAIVAGPSGIVLDAALMNVPSVVYSFGRDVLDPYGYAQHGFAVVASNEGRLLDHVRTWAMLEHLPSVRSLTSHFVATVDSRFDGASTDLVAMTMLALTTTGGVPPVWVMQTSPNGTPYYSPAAVQDSPLAMLVTR